VQFPGQLHAKKQQWKYEITMAKRPEFGEAKRLRCIEHSNSTRKSINKWCTTGHSLVSVVTHQNVYDRISLVI
jgi:hypothetical protein